MVRLSGTGETLILSISIWSSVEFAAKNVEIQKQRDIAVTETDRANASAEEAKASARLAYQWAIDAKDSVVQMLITVRNEILGTEDRLRPAREQLLRIASRQLDRLPDESDDMPEEQWLGQKLTFRGMLADQDQFRATLLASMVRDDEAVSEQATILANVRQFATADQSPGAIESKATLAQALVYSGDMQRQRGESMKHSRHAPQRKSSVCASAVWRQLVFCEDRKPFAVFIKCLSILLRTPWFTTSE